MDVGNDLAATYAATRAAIDAVVRGLSPADEERPVPACPGWRVHDLVAHLTGVAEDGANGDLAGAPGAEWTARHLERRRSVPLAVALDDWARYSASVEELIAGGHPMAMPFTLDVITHRHDLHGALGLPFPATAPHASEFDRASVRFATEMFGKVFGRRVRDAGLPAVRFEDDGWSFRAGTAEPDVVVRAPAVEVFRALTGRRGHSQVSAWEWSGDPSPYLEHFSPFGPLPETDVVEPA